MHELPASLQKSLRSYRGSVRLSRDEETLSGFGEPIEDRESQSSTSHHGKEIAPRPQSYAQPYLHSDTSHRNSSEQEHEKPRALNATPVPTFDPRFNPPDIDPAARRDAQDPTPLNPDEFYELVGMQPPVHGAIPRRLEERGGLYDMIRQRERLMNRQYRAWDIVAVSFLVIQLILSAVFIILGSINKDHHITIAILGAISTLIAGILALMRGQGLPNRLRMERDELRVVLFEAAELYWDVGAGQPVTFDDVKKLRESYLRVVEDSVKNHPDTWNKTDTKIAAPVIQSTLKPGVKP